MQFTRMKCNLTCHSFKENAESFSVSFLFHKDVIFTRQPLKYTSYQ